MAILSYGVKPSGGEAKGELLATAAVTVMGWWLCLALLAYVITALLPAVNNDWGQIARNFFIPSWSQDPAFITTVVGTSAMYG